LVGNDEITFLEQAELARYRRPAQPELASQFRWASEPEREERDDLSARRVS
jgi:hypothetical protein